MSEANEIQSLPPEIQKLITQEVERQLKKQSPQPPEELDDPPVLHAIEPVPRGLPLAVSLYLRLSYSAMPLFGWFFTGVGFLFVLIAVTFIGLDDLIPRTWSDVGKGRITNIEVTNFHINDNKIFAYHFEANDMTNGISYGYEGKYKTNAEVSLRQSGNLCRIEGLTLTPGGWMFPLIFIGIGSLFGIIGLGFPVYSWFAGGKAVRLLRDGIATKARFHSVNPTFINVNRRSVMRVDFEYQVDGETYTASTSALDTTRLTGTQCKIVLYDPMKPSRSVVLDGLPRGIRLDELTGRFCVNPLRCVIPLLAATIVCGEMVAIVVMVVLAI